LDYTGQIDDEAISWRSLPISDCQFPILSLAFGLRRTFKSEVDKLKPKDQTPKAKDAIGNRKSATDSVLLQLADSSSMIPTLSHVK